MPILFHIDHARRLVIARGKGAFTEADMFAYQRGVWSQPQVAGYDELVDMTDVEKIIAPSPVGPAMRQLAAEAAQQDDPTQSAKFAIVAPTSLGFGLSREYQSYRELQAQNSKQVRVFRTLAEALVFLGIDGPECLEPYRTGPDLNSGTT
jgi:hypothetical protein